MRALLLMLLLALCTSAQSQDSASTLQESRAVGASDKDDTSTEEHQVMYPKAKAEQEAAILAGKPAEAPVRVTVSGTDSTLAWGLLGFTFLVMCIEAIVIVKAKKAWSPHSIVRAFGITLIIPVSALLIVAGYSENQISPAFGLLGVIAGYLLGNGEKSRPGP